MLRVNPDVDLLECGFTRGNEEEDWVNDRGIVVSYIDRSISVNYYMLSDENKILDGLFELITEGAVSRYSR